MLPLMQVKRRGRLRFTMEPRTTWIFKGTIMGRLLLAGALFLATMTITASMAAAAGPLAQPQAGAITQYQDPN